MADDNVLQLPLRRAPSQPAAGERRTPEPLWREALGDELRNRRLDRDERIADVAGRAGVAPQYLSELERGRKDPSSEVLAAVSGALGVGVGELTRRVGLRLAHARPADTVRAATLPSGPVCLAA